MSFDIKPKIFALITARGGSKTIPNKNIADVAGKPLIAWTIETALKSSYVKDVIVSTDSRQIAEISIKFGAKAPFTRPSSLARDDSPHVPVIIHAVQWIESHEDMKYDYILLLQPTSPLRITEDINSAIKKAIEKNADSVVSVSEAASHPYFLRTIDNKGYLKNFVNKPEGYLRRQDLPRIYAENGAIYVIRRDVIMNDKMLYSKNAYAYIMPSERSLDIDSLWDLKIANYILENRNKILDVNIKE